ncbi:MAG: MgtC/SapB family protein, partial [Geobacteraceae bacterium]
MVYGLDLVISGQLLLASLLGGLIGLEREVHGRPAGFRTHLLVSLGSCLFVAVSIHFYRLYGNFSGTGPIGVDPGRVAAQVVAGIGFLGAGAIIKDKASVRGLTTAASLWVA